MSKILSTALLAALVGIAAPAFASSHTEADRKAMATDKMASGDKMATDKMATDKMATDKTRWRPATR